MAFLSVDRDGTEQVSRFEPLKFEEEGWWNGDLNSVILPNGTIEKILGRKLTWEADPEEM